MKYLFEKTSNWYKLIINVQSNYWGNSKQSKNNKIYCFWTVW